MNVETHALMSLLEDELPSVYQKRWDLIVNGYVFGERSDTDYNTLIHKLEMDIVVILIGVNAISRTIVRDNKYDGRNIYTFKDLIKYIGHYVLPRYVTGTSLTKDILVNLNSLATTLFEHLKIESEALAVDIALKFFKKEYDKVRSKKNLESIINSENYRVERLEKYATIIRCIRDIYDPDNNTYNDIIERKHDYRVFISLGLHNKSEDEVKATLKKSVEDISSIIGDDFIVVHNADCDGPENVGRLYYLGEAIKQMDRCDAIYFADGWKDHKGCRVEYQVAREYGIKIIKE